MIRIPRAVTWLAAAVIVAMAGACSRGGGMPEARLGSSPSNGTGGRYDRDGAFGDRRGGVQSLGALEALKASGDDLVYFSSDSSELTPEARTTISAQASWLRSNPGAPITIEGHADERGTREYNIALGAKRASAVKALLVAYGIEPARIRTTSFGKERPIAVCNDISCWSQNRRAQTVLASQAISRN